MGFSLQVGPSSLGPKVGRGVFVAPGVRDIPKGKVVALYPGTVYEAGQPILLQSVANQYILRYGRDSGVLIWPSLCSVHPQMCGRCEHRRQVRRTVWRRVFVAARARASASDEASLRCQLDRRSDSACEPSQCRTGASQTLRSQFIP